MNSYVYNDYDGKHREHQYCDLNRDQLNTQEMSLPEAFHGTHEFNN